MWDYYCTNYSNSWRLLQYWQLKLVETSILLKKYVLYYLFWLWKTCTVEVLSVEICCLCRWLVYTDNGFHLIICFKIYIQTMSFTWNRDLKKGCLHRQWFSPSFWFYKKVINTDNSSFNSSKYRKLISYYQFKF